MARLKGISPNLSAFLDMLAVSEGTATSHVTKNDGYDVIVSGISGPEIFTNYKEHPFANRLAKKINFVGLYSTAAGRYQFLKVHWLYYKSLLKLPDFGPESQDRWAIQLIKERGALPNIEMGLFDEAVNTVRTLWASLPNAGYGQREHKLQTLRDIYILKGGKLWKSVPSLPLSLAELPQSLEPINTVPLPLESKPMQIIELDKHLTMRSELSRIMKKLLRRK